MLYHFPAFAKSYKTKLTANQSVIVQILENSNSKNINPATDADDDGDDDWEFYFILFYLGFTLGFLLFDEKSINYRVFYVIYVLCIDINILIYYHRMMLVTNAYNYPN